MLLRLCPADAKCTTCALTGRAAIAHQPKLPHLGASRGHCGCRRLKIREGVQLDRTVPSDVSGCVWEDVNAPIGKVGNAFIKRYLTGEQSADGAYGALQREGRGMCAGWAQRRTGHTHPGLEERPSLCALRVAGGSASEIKVPDPAAQRTWAPAHTRWCACKCGVGTPRRSSWQPSERPQHSDRPNGIRATSSRARRTGVGTGS